MSAVLASELAPPAPAINVRLLEVALQALPHAHLIRDIDVHSQPDALRFTWRGVRYRIGEGFHVEEVQGSCLAGTDNAILMERLLRLVSYELSHADMVLPA